MRKTKGEKEKRKRKRNKNVLNCLKSFVEAESRNKRKYNKKKNNKIKKD